MVLKIICLVFGIRYLVFGYKSSEYLPKLSLTAFSTLVMWKPEAQMVIVGNATSVTGRAVFFNVVTTYVVKINTP